MRFIGMLLGGWRSAELNIPGSARGFKRTLCDSLLRWLHPTDRDTFEVIWSALMRPNGVHARKRGAMVAACGCASLSVLSSDYLYGASTLSVSHLVRLIQSSRTPRNETSQEATDAN